MWILCSMMFNKKQTYVNSDIVDVYKEAKKNN